LSGFEEKRKLPRVDVQWPVTMITKRGAVDGEVRNITTEGVYVHCTEQLTLNEIYRLMIGSPGGTIDVMGRVIWSNLDILPGSGFCFVEVSEKDRDLLQEAIQRYGEK
jgi:hypothetical protein